MAQFLDTLKKKFTELRPSDATRIVPCSETEISDLEQQMSIRLPLAYREFLLWTGRGGGFLSSTYCFYQTLPQINAWAHELLTRTNSSLNLPEDAFVFAFDESQMFYFFQSSEGDNPKVYLFIETELKRHLQNSPRESFSSAWAFLFDDEEQTDFYIFSPSFTLFLDYEMEQYIMLKQKTEAWRANYK